MPILHVWHVSTITDLAFYSPSRRARSVHQKCSRMSRVLRSTWSARLLRALRSSDASNSCVWWKILDTVCQCSMKEVLKVYNIEQRTSDEPYTQSKISERWEYNSPFALRRTWHRKPRGIRAACSTKTSEVDTFEGLDPSLAWGSRDWDWDRYRVWKE